MKEPLLFSVDLGNKSVKEMSTHVSPTLTSLSYFEQKYH